MNGHKSVIILIVLAANLLLISCSFAQSFNIRFVDAGLIYNQHVGNDWLLWLSIGGSEIKKGETISVRSNEMDVVAHAYEGNEKYDDHGYTVKRYNAGMERIQEINVIVTEHHGRYAGGKAKWKFTIEIFVDDP